MSCRRAASLRRALEADAGTNDPLRAMDWIELYALAVNEENAAGGRVVTAPTNGAAGIVPAVLHYYRDFVPGFDEEGVARSARSGRDRNPVQAKRLDLRRRCRLPGRGRLSVFDGRRRIGRGPRRNTRPGRDAAEIAMEHNLGLTCDPVGGLVQIPCIERNALASVKAVAATRLALRGDGRHRVSLDTVIKTMRNTGADMSSKYKETSQGGLAVNVANC